MYHEFLMPYVKLMSIVNKHLGQNSTGQSTSTTLRNPLLTHKHDSAGSPVI
jgi:hypothetical protein